MKTIIYQSDALAAHFNDDLCPNVIIKANFISTKETQYDTPFGPSYGWVKKCTGIENVSFEMNITFSNSFRKIEEVSIFDIYKSIEGLEEEIQKIIEQHEGVE